MGGWPSTTGNPSGGGRWNNEEDDDGCEDGGYWGDSTTNRISGPVYSNYTQPSPAQLLQYKIDEVWDEYRNNPEKEEIKQRVQKLKDEMGYLGRAIGKEYWGYSEWSGMDDIAVKYFKCKSISEFSDTILAPLAEIIKKIYTFKDERGCEIFQVGKPIWMERVLALPKLSETDHICRKEGFTEYHERSSQPTNYEYIWKKDWNDAEESIHLVNREYNNYNITKEALDKHEERKAEFVSLQKAKEPLKKRALDAYVLFKNHRCGHRSHHFMDRGPLEQIKADNVFFAHNEKYNHELKDVDADLMEIYNHIEKDWNELNEERNMLIDELNNMEIKVRKEIADLNATEGS